MPRPRRDGAGRVARGRRHRHPGHARGAGDADAPLLPVVHGPDPAPGGAARAPAPGRDPRRHGRRPGRPAPTAPLVRGAAGRLLGRGRGPGRQRRGARGARQLRRRAVRPDRRPRHRLVRPVHEEPGRRPRGVPRRGARLARGRGPGRPAGPAPHAPHLLRRRVRHQRDLGGSRPRSSSSRARSCSAGRSSTPSSSSPPSPWSRRHPTVPARTPSRCWRWPRARASPWPSCCSPCPTSARSPGASPSPSAR